MSVRKRRWLTDAQIAAWASKNSAPLAEAKVALNEALQTAGAKSNASRDERAKANALLNAAKAGGAWLCDHIAPNGKRVVEQFKSEREAKAREAQVRVDIGKGAYVKIDAKATVAQAGERWIENCEAEQLRPVTLKQYRSHLKNHINKHIGNVKLGALDVDRCTAFRNQLKAECKSDAMAAKVWTSFKSVLKTVRMSHVVDGVGLSAPPAPELVPGTDLPTLEEMPRIIAAAESGRQRAMVLLLAYCGLRSGELRALRWSDISGLIVSVNRGVDQWGNFFDPKTKRSRRKLDMPPAIIPHLLTWKMESPFKKDSDLVFPNLEDHRPGGSRHHDRVTTELERILKAAAVTDDGSTKGTPKYSGLHPYRHWFASWSLHPRDRGGRGLGLGEVSRMLGHASEVITEKRYGHWFPGYSTADSFAADTAKMLAGL